MLVRKKIEKWKEIEPGLVDPASKVLVTRHHQSSFL
jgi:hypothetical protein